MASLLRSVFLIQMVSSVAVTVGFRGPITGSMRIKPNVQSVVIQEKEPVFAGELEKEGFLLVDQAIREELSSLQADEITKLLATVHRSVNRHTVQGREYIDFIHRHVGSRISGGLRIIKNFR